MCRTSFCVKCWVLKKRRDECFLIHALNGCCRCLIKFKQIIFNTLPPDLSFFFVEIFDFFPGGFFSLVGRESIFFKGLFNQRWFTILISFFCGVSGGSSVWGNSIFTNFFNTAKEFFRLINRRDTQRLSLTSKTLEIIFFHFWWNVRFLMYQKCWLQL